MSDHPSSTDLSALSAPLAPGALLAELLAARRAEGRDARALRPLSFELAPQRYAAGSVVVRWGHTHVLCAATLEERLPPHAERNGWVSAEYALLPGSTHTRAARERKAVSGRTAEIQRLIGRSLRGALDLDRLEGHALTVDCDVLQADGGTRCASITGAYVAVAIALARFGYLPPHFAALSFGLLGGEVLSDLCYEEDSRVDVDCNVVWSEAGLIEVQGTAERGAFTSAQLMEMLSRAEGASGYIFERQRHALRAAGVGA
ncbi:MAG: ribonuclease PH [Deltaproteobacteria bacterium]|nr:ribonuclease PH [Deltaproteobacteria bacterium]